VRNWTIHPKPGVFTFGFVVMDPLPGFPSEETFFHSKNIVESYEDASGVQLHLNEPVMVPLGSRVTFTVGVDNRGRSTMYNVHVLPKESAAAAVEPGQASSSPSSQPLSTALKAPPLQHDGSSQMRANEPCINYSMRGRCEHGNECKQKSARLFAAKNPQYAPRCSGAEEISTKKDHADCAPTDAPNAAGISMHASSSSSSSSCMIEKRTSSIAAAKPLGAGATATSTSLHAAAAKKKNKVQNVHKPSNARNVMVLDERDASVMQELLAQRSSTAKLFELCTLPLSAASASASAVADAGSKVNSDDNKLTVASKATEELVSDAMSLADVAFPPAAQAMGQHSSDLVALQGAGSGVILATLVAAAMACQRSSTQGLHNTQSILAMFIFLPQSIQRKRRFRDEEERIAMRVVNACVEAEVRASATTVAEGNARVAQLKHFAVRLVTSKACDSVKLFGQNQKHGREQQGKYAAALHESAVLRDARVRDAEHTERR
jgi:hypothetical protein